MITNPFVKQEIEAAQPRHVGSGKFRYRAVPGWGRLPSGKDFGEVRDVVGVATDSKRRVYVFNRGKIPIIILDHEGRFIGSWGENQFVRPHGIYIGSDDSIYCTGDVDQTVRKFTVDGELRMQLGVSGIASDTGAIPFDWRSIKRAGPPFNMPTNLAVAPDGTLFVSDGYANARVHHFSADGKLLNSWGSPGSEPGQFNTVHGIAADSAGRVYVADRENSRIQVFDPSGRFLTQWTDVARPNEVFVDAQDNIFVVEMGWKAGLFPWQVPPPNGTLGRLSIFDLSGRLQARWGGGGDPTAPGDFFAPHDVWVDRAGDIYVGEVLNGAGFDRALFFRDGHPLQKFVRIS